MSDLTAASMLVDAEVVRAEYPAMAGEPFRHHVYEAQDGEGVVLKLTEHQAWELHVLWYGLVTANALFGVKASEDYRR